LTDGDPTTYWAGWRINPAATATTVYSADSSQAWIVLDYGPTPQKFSKLRFYGDQWVLAIRRI